MHFYGGAGVLILLCVDVLECLYDSSLEKYHNSVVFLSS